MVDVYDKRQAAAARAMADGAMPAGRPTAPLNAAFCAFDYLPSKLDRQRSFLMDDYLSSGRMARAQSESSRRDTSWEVLQYQKDIEPFIPEQGFNQTKFHAGFMRRQASNIPYLVEREALRNREPMQRAPRPRQSYDILTSEGMDPSMDRAHGERRHITDAREARAGSTNADAPAGRLRDSTSRFFCTAEQLPHRPYRQQLQETDGLTITKRTSTVIGVGANPSQEIYSIGAREVLSDSIYGIKRRAAGMEAAAQSADVAAVRALP